jgi:hypothetical protein
VTIGRTTKFNVLRFVQSFQRSRHLLVLAMSPASAAAGVVRTMTMTRWLGQRRICSRPMQLSSFL